MESSVVRGLHRVHLAMAWGNGSEYSALQGWYPHSALSLMQQLEKLHH